MKLQSALKRIGACAEAIEWAADREFSAAWKECPRGDWMLWLCGRLADTPGWPSRQVVVLFTCDIAESLLPLFESRYPNDDRPRKAIEAARAWARVASTDQAAAAAWRADRDGKLAEIADLVRQRLTVPDSLEFAKRAEEKNAGAVWGCGGETGLA